MLACNHDRRGLLSPGHCCSNVDVFSFVSKRQRASETAQAGATAAVAHSGENFIKCPNDIPLLSECLGRQDGLPCHLAGPTDDCYHRTNYPLDERRLKKSALLGIYSA
jgi:hypothetical protein